MKPSQFLFTMIFGFALASLSEGCRMPSNDLTPEETDIVDTLYNSQISLLRQELDSICDVQQDSMINGKADSLVELQLIEIRKLVDRQ